MKFYELALGEKFRCGDLIYTKTGDRVPTNKNNAICERTLDGARRVPCRIPYDSEVKIVYDKTE